MNQIEQWIVDGRYNIDMQIAHSFKTPEERTNYRIAVSKVNQMLRDDLEAEFGTANYSKRDQLWDKAWADGHAEGFYSVVQHYEELVEIIDLSGVK